MLRRRLLAGAGAALLVALAIVLVWPQFHHAVREITLPLRHEDIIRQQAQDKGLDPALIAAVIYAESRFRDGQTSPAGARGPDAAHARPPRAISPHKSGGTQFVPRASPRPQVNIAYGAYYLRYLLRPLRGQDQTFALAAYNAGEGNVDRWIAAAPGARPRDRRSTRSRTPERAPMSVACSPCAGSPAARTPSNSARVSLAYAAPPHTCPRPLF